jgi:hypothetical protein
MIVLITRAQLGSRNTVVGQFEEDSLNSPGLVTWRATREGSPLAYSHSNRGFSPVETRTT